MNAPWHGPPPVPYARGSRPAAVAGAALLTLSAGGGLAAQEAPDLYTARLARPAPVAEVTVGGIEWSCEGVTCQVESTRSLSNVKACEGLASEVGRIVAFGPSGGDGLEASELSLCNRAAGVGTDDGGTEDEFDGSDDGDGEVGDRRGDAPTSAVTEAARRVAERVARRAGDVARAELDRTCVPLRLTVGGRDANVGESGFASLRAALLHASDADACAVRVRLKAGEHQGSVSLDRDTELVGPERGRAVFRGTLGNRGPYRLSVRGVHLRGAGRPGAVSVDHPRARTELRLLTVSGARGYGVRQEGGRLVLERVNVFGIAAVVGLPGSGAGVLLSDGAEARLDGVTLADNETGGLVLRGTDTRARATKLHVLRTGAPPAGAPHPGAVRVSGDATLLASVPRLDDNEVAGLHVRDGGRAHLRGGYVRRTRAAGDRSGVNVVVDGGAAVFRDVTLSDADLAGLVVDGGGSVSLVNGTVSRNAIGVSLRSFHPLTCLQRGTVYRDNEINLDRATPPVPGEEAEESGRCARVPWRWK